MNAEQRARVERATVSLFQTEDGESFTRHGQGVLLRGRFIATAAHCVHAPDNATTDLGEPQLVKIQTADARVFVVSVLVFEPVSDIALLGSAPEAFADHADAFDGFVACNAPLDLATWTPRAGRVMPGRRATRPESRGVHILKHEGGWLDGKIYGGTPWTGAPRLDVSTDAEIPAGTSGGPVVDDDGRLVGVVSTNLHVPLLHRALPYWARSRIIDGG